MARCRAVSSSFMVSSAVRPLPVARGGRSSHEREPGGGHGYRREHRLRHQSRRCVVAPEREKLYDALSEKAPRCVVGSHLVFMLAVLSTPWVFSGVLVSVEVRADPKGRTSTVADSLFHE